MTTSQHDVRFDLYSGQFTEDPYATYDAMRTHTPAYRAEYPGGLELWLVTRYEDVCTVLSDPRFSMSSDNSASPLFKDDEPKEDQRGLDRNLTNLDPPDHTKLRRLVTREFSAARVEALRPKVQAHVDELIDTFAPKGRADLIGEFAAPLPTGVAGELLGVTASGWAEFRVLSNLLVSPDYDMTPDDFDQNKRRIRAFVRRLIENKRQSPGDDLTSSLTNACDEEGAISEDDLVGIVFTLLVGSQETTTNFIGNAALALLQQPDQMELLRERPELIMAATDELIRYDGPFEVSSLRFPTEDVEVGGVTIPKGATVVAVLAAANRDPNRFAEPDRVDIQRPDNAHVGFGRSIHFCPGRMLSLLEAEIAITGLLERLPDLRLAGAEPLPWKEGLFFRGLRALPVEFAPAPSTLRP
jgi:cytochrome P450